MTNIAVLTINNDKETGSTCAVKLVRTVNGEHVGGDMIVPVGGTHNVLVNDGSVLTIEVIPPAPAA